MATKELLETIAYASVAWPKMVMQGSAGGGLPFFALGAGVAFYCFGSPVDAFRNAQYLTLAEGYLTVGAVGAGSAIAYSMAKK